MVDATELTVGDRVENPSQRSGKVYEVVEIREEQTFDGEETVFLVEKASGPGTNTVREDIIYEKDHDRWELADDQEA